MRELSWEEVKKIIRRIGEWGILGLIHCLGQQTNQRFILPKWYSSHEGHEQSSKKVPTLLRVPATAGSGRGEPSCEKQLSSGSLAEAGKGTSGLKLMQNRPPHVSGMRRK